MSTPFLPKLPAMSRMSQRQHGIMTSQLEAVVMQWEGRALDLEAVAKDLERAGIAATDCRDTAEQLRHNAQEVKDGRPITLLPRLKNKKAD